jgi:hypothetical protein
MAAIQYGSTSGKVPVKKNFLKDLGNVAINTALSPIEGLTGKNFFNPEMTTGFGKSAAGVGDFLGNVTGAVAPMALNLVAPGAGTALSTVAKGVGNSIDTDPTSGAGVAMGSALGSLAGNKDAMDFAKGLFRKGGYLKFKKAMKKYADGGIILPTYINMPENNEHATGGNLEINPNGLYPNINPKQFETKLSSKDETKFQSWFDNHYKRGHIMQGDYDFYKKNGYGLNYDYRSAFSNKVEPKINRVDGLYHWNDFGKKPNEPTFSNESKYNSNVMPGGSWKGENYTPPSTNSIVPNTSVFPKQYNMGGNLTRYNGMKHEDGGIPISNTDEVEGGETSFQQGSQNPNDPGTFIFSDSILVPGTKKTFADESKKIDNRYKKRENDVWATNAKKMQLGKLAELQEQVKGTTEQQGMQMSPDGSVHKMGGKMQSNMKANGTSRYNLSKKMMNIHDGGGGITNFNSIASGVYNPNKKVPYAPYVQPLPNAPVVQPRTNIVATQPVVNNPIISKTNDLSELGLTQGDIQIDPYKINKMNMLAPSVKTPATLDMGLQTNKVAGVNPVGDKGFNSDMIIPMAGYGLQALTNLPMLLAKPNKATYDRITPEKVDLTGQRLEAQGSRNKALSVAKRNASMLGSASAINSFNGAAISDIYGKYGDQINNSLMNEKNTNAGIVNDTRGKNAQIQMAEVEANQREADAVRSAKQQALFNIGQAGAAAGKAFGNAKQSDNMMKAISTDDYSYDKSTGNYILKRKGYRCGGKLKKGGK